MTDKGTQADVKNGPQGQEIRYWRVTYIVPDGYPLDLATEFAVHESQRMSWMLFTKTLTAIIAFLYGNDQLAWGSLLSLLLIDFTMHYVARDALSKPHPETGCCTSFGLYRFLAVLMTILVGVSFVLTLLVVLSGSVGFIFALFFTGVDLYFYGKAEQLSRKLGQQWASHGPGDGNV